MQNDTEDFSKLKASLAKSKAWNEKMAQPFFMKNEGLAAVFEMSKNLKNIHAIAVPPVLPIASNLTIQSLAEASEKAKTLFAPFKSIEALEVNRAAIDAISHSFTISDALKDIFKTITFYTELSKHSLAFGGWEKLGQQIAIQENTKKKMASVFTNLDRSYLNFFNAAQKNPASFTNINPSITRIIPAERFAGSNLLEVISVEEEERQQNTREAVIQLSNDNEISLHLYLPKVKNGLVNMWTGAVQTLQSDNIEKQRHFIVSLRELFTHVMHELAPDKSIKNWSQNPQHYDKNNKPTRKARLEYIYRDINNKEFGDFFSKDIEATLTFIDIFQKATHRIENNFSDQQLLAIKAKAETTLNFMLEVYFKSQHQRP